jgi:hypothetical protein
MGVQPGKATNDPQSYIAWGKQTAKGSEASTFHFLKYLDGNGFTVEKTIQREREGGDGQEVGLTYVSMVKADGTLSANARGEFAARIAAAALGSDTVGSAAVPSLARHTAALVASQPYYTVDQRWNDEVERTIDCVFSGMTITGEAGKPWQMQAGFISGGTVYQRDVGSSLTPTREQGKPFFYANGSYVFDGGASYSADFTKIKLEVTRSLDDNIQTTGLGRDDVIGLNFDCNVEGTLKYTSRDFYRKIQYNGGSVVLSDLATGSVDIAALQQVQVASGAFATGLMRHVMPLIEWTDAKVNKLDPDGKTVYLDVVGMGVKGATTQFFSVIDCGNATPFA